MTHLAPVAALVISLLSAASAAAAPDEHAGGARAAPAARPSVRTTDRRLKTLVADGVRRSETFRGLVARLEASDVVVYLRCDMTAPARVAGRLTFVTAAGGFRYVVVRMQELRSTTHQLALLAHELQHAVEIADTPAIVDGDSLAREYARIGYANPLAAVSGLAFDTTMAVEAGQQVLRELNGVAAAD